MAFTNFIPELWNANLLEALTKAHVYTQAGIANRDYEGEIKQHGDTVHVTSIADPTITNWTKGTVVTPEELADSKQTLTIDQGKSFAFNVQDLDQVQVAGPFVAEASSRAAWGLAEQSDKFVADALRKAVPSGAVVSASGGLDASVPSGAYPAIVQLRTALDKANIPAAGRWLIVSPDFYAMLLQDDRFIKANEAGTDAGLRNGQVGRVLGFDVMESNNAPSGATSSLVAQVAGYSGAYSFAEQVLQTEALRNPNQFADIVRGLYVYGGQVFRPTGLAAIDLKVS